MLCNALVVDHQVNLKKIRKLKTDEFEYYHPSTQAVELRTFFAHMNTMQDWRYTKKDLSGFKGSLQRVMKEVFAQRLKKYVSYLI